MCTVSITEFNNNPAKYFDIAQNETVVIRSEGKSFELVQKEIFLSVEDAKKRSHEHIEKLFASK